MFLAKNNCVGEGEEEEGVLALAHQTFLKVQLPNLSFTQK